MTRFGTILSGRSNNAPPTDLEVELRKQCKILKVVSNGLNGANLLLPPASTGEVTLAVRVYYGASLPPDEPVTMEDLKASPSLDDIDGLLDFQQSFALTLVFFVLTDEERDLHLNSTGSFVRRAMHRLTTSSLHNKKLLNNTTRVMIVPTSHAAVEALIHFADALKPEKRERKQAFYEQRRLMHFLPPFTAETQDTAASHALAALYEWSQSNQIPDREMDIVIGLCGTLESLVAQAATGLTEAPVSPRTKKLLYEFFYGNEEDAFDETMIPSSGTVSPESSTPNAVSMQSLAMTQGTQQGMYPQPMYGQSSADHTQQYQQPLPQFGQRDHGWTEEPHDAMAPPFNPSLTADDHRQGWIRAPVPAPPALHQEDQSYPTMRHPQYQHQQAYQPPPNYANRYPSAPPPPQQQQQPLYHHPPGQRMQQQQPMYQSQYMHPLHQQQAQHPFESQPPQRFAYPQQPDPYDPPATQYPRQMYR